MQQIIVCLIGQNKPDLLKSLSKAILDAGGNIGDCRMTVLGEHVTVMMVLSGSWDTIVKIETLLPRLEMQLELTCLTKRTEVRPKSVNLLPYMVEIVALYHPEIIYEITNFFATHAVVIEELVSNRFIATQTDTPILSLTITIHVPASSSIAQLRGEFMDLCDELNLDAVMGPLK
jgi:glycine cleavage system transcriptional repressor